MRSVLAERPVALAKFRASRGLITTTGNPAVSKAASKVRSRPPVASTTMRVGDRSVQLRHECLDMDVIIDDLPSLITRPHREVQRGFGHVNACKQRRRCHHNSCQDAPPCRMRARLAQTTVRALSGKDVPTQAPLRSGETDLEGDGLARPEYII